MTLNSQRSSSLCLSKYWDYRHGPPCPEIIRQSDIKSFNCFLDDFLWCWQGVNESNFDIGVCGRTPKAFPDRKGLACLNLVDLQSLEQCLPLPHLLHTPECWGLLFGLCLKSINSRNALPTIPFQMILLTTIKTSDIWFFWKCLKITSPISIINVKFNSSCISNPFICCCWPCL